MRPPVLGSVPINGSLPIYGKHKGTDAVFALAYNYTTVDFVRFIGSLRKSGYTEDIVIAVSPKEKLKPEVKEYLQMNDVVAYEFALECARKDICRLTENFLGFDPSFPSIDSYLTDMRTLVP
jgi:hypothetical protein